MVPVPAITSMLQISNEFSEFFFAFSLLIECKSPNLGQSMVNSFIFNNYNRFSVEICCAKSNLIAVRRRRTQQISYDVVYAKSTSLCDHSFTITQTRQHIIANGIQFSLWLLLIPVSCVCLTSDNRAVKIQNQHYQPFN